MEIHQHLHYTNSRSDQGAPAGGAALWETCFILELRKKKIWEKKMFSHVSTNDKKNEGTYKDDPVKPFLHQLSSREHRRENYLHQTG